jgi:predicted GIY-YIG superfamily endonuclease
MAFMVYILRDERNNLYIGQTSCEEARVKQHLHKNVKSAKFVKDGGSFKPVYKEEFSTRTAAMKRERRLKGWTRAKKEELITGELDLLKRL